MSSWSGIFIPFIHFMLQRIDTHIQFKTDEQYQGVKINEQHQDQDGADGSIQFIVIGKIAHVIGEPQGENDHKECGENGTRVYQSPLLIHKSSIAVYKRNGQEEHQYNQQPAEIMNNEDEGQVFDTEPSQHCTLGNQGNHGKEEQDEQEEG